MGLFLTEARGQADLPKQDADKNSAEHFMDAYETLPERADASEASIDELIETVNDGYLTPYYDRIGHTPSGTDAFFEGVRGESKCVPNGDSEKGRVTKEKLAHYGQDGVEYQGGYPDFIPCAEAVVEIDHMTSARYDNFNQAYDKLAEQWNASKREGREDWRPSDVRDWQKGSGLVIHECPDRKTCVFVDKDIHETFLHSGGVCECLHFEAMIQKGDFYDKFDN